MSKASGIGIARWLFIAFVGVSGLVATVIGVSLKTSDMVQHNSEQLVQKGIPALEEIGNLERSVSAWVNRLYLFYATTEQEPFVREQQKLLTLIRRDLSLVRQHGIASSQAEQLESGILQLQGAIGRFTAEMQSGSRDWDLLRVHLAQAQSIADRLDQTLAQWQVSIRTRARNGGQATLKEVNNLSTILVIFSVTVSAVAGFVLWALYGRVKDRDALFRLAYVDELTGLPNRLQLEESIESRIEQQKNGSLFLLKVDRYELLTSTYGHSTGHLLILNASQWLEQQLAALPVEASLYRYSDDSWMIHCLNKTDKQALTALAENLLELSLYPISVEQRPFNMHCTLGVSRYPVDGLKAESLCRNTLAALQDAADNPDSYCFFDKEMTRSREQWLAIDSALREALEKNEFELYYQVKVCSKNTEAVGAEALIRWWRNGEMVPPGQFINIAERSGLIVPIGNWVLEQACRQLQEWRNHGYRLIPIAVNISAQQFQQADFPDLVSDALARYQLEPRYLELEITEEVAAAHPDQVVATMGRLKGIGVSIALDDFGTGYSSLSYLQRFPIDTLKIDRSFVRHMDSCAENYAIIDLMLSLARQMGYNVVAEGVETKEQHKTLQTKGCDMLQGFLFDKPQPVSNFLAYLQKRSEQVSLA